MTLHENLFKLSDEQIRCFDDKYGMFAYLSIINICWLCLLYPRYMKYTGGT